MKPIAQWTIIIGLAVVVTAGMYMFVYKGMAEANQANLQVLKDKQAEIDQLRPYEAKLPELLAQIESLKQQMEIQKKIVPDEKEADKFIHLMQDTAAQSGVEVRRYTSQAAQQKEFYTEVPFQMEVDGPYYSMLNFFERTGKLERIVNMTGLTMGAIRGKGAAAGKYEYAPNESVVAVATASTFYSRDVAPTPAPAAKPAAK
ncbi:type 4a pilus biogenesis protein PilO [Candidatus Korobacter versatilis]|nr:type 4a pilus biogenesis protein PilO [Candidatus Koribacter versatilis]